MRIKKFKVDSPHKRWIHQYKGYNSNCLHIQFRHVPIREGKHFEGDMYVLFSPESRPIKKFNIPPKSARNGVRFRLTHQALAYLHKTQFRELLLPSIHLVRIVGHIDQTSI